MSMTQTQKEAGEVGWSCLDALGLSQKELVLAEALQMEYDALSRLKQEKGSTGTSQSGPELTSHNHGQITSTSPIPFAEHSQPIASQPVLTSMGECLLGELSGADSSLNQPGGSHSPPSIPARANMLQGDHVMDSPFILNNPEQTKLGDSSPSYRDSSTSGSGILLKGFSSLPEDVPPAIPPRNPIPSSSGSQNPFLPPRWSTMPRNVNLFTPDVDQPKVVSGELNYEIINDSLSQLNESHQDSRGRKVSGDQLGKPVARSKTLPPQVPPRTYAPLTKSNKNQRRVSAYPVSLGSRMNGFSYELFQVSEERDEEVAAFCHMLDVLRSAYPCSDRSKNTGFVWSPSVTRDEMNQVLGVSVKVTVISEHFREPLTFTCDTSSSVDLLIYQTLCYAQDDLDHVDVDEYLLQIYGQEEFLSNSQTLAGLEFVQQSLKFHWDIRLVLTRRSAVRTELTRTKEDDDTVSTMNHNILLQERPIKQTVTREALTLLLDTFHNEAESFVMSEVDLPLHVERLVQSVKALCSSLAAVETPDVTSALSLLPACPCRLQPKVQKDASVLAVRENRETVVEKLTASILDLVELYCNTFNANFHPTVQSRCFTAPMQEAGHITSILSFNIYAAHRIPITWAASYEGFFLSCLLTHGGVELCAPQHTSKQAVSKYLFHLVVWDHRVCFPVQINQLPRESQLTVTLYASTLPPPGGAEEKGKQRRIEALGWVTMPLFNFRHTLTCGRKLFGLWPSTPGRSGNARSSSPNFNQPDSVILQVDFPTSSFEVLFSTPPPADFCPQYEFSKLDTASQSHMQDVLHKKSFFWLTSEDKRLLWEKKAFCQAESAALPLVLASATCWEWACLPEIYALLKQWVCLGHLDALGLLHASFPDQELRRTAVQWMDSISDSELLDFLPQLVQALKYECYLDSSLIRFLLRRAIGDIRIAHYLFWLLKDNLQDSQFSARYQQLLGALLCCVGCRLRDEFDRQCWMVSVLTKVAQKVRDAPLSSRQVVLKESLEEMKHFFSVNSSCRLPLNPALLVKGINIQSCSFFNSNAVPLKLSFKNPLGDNVSVIFKSGDDLRQDMLTLQVIRIMNKIWIQEGLDMRMVIFKCFSTGRGRGMVEMIPQAETLRKIQVEHGVTGSFKDRPLADWLQKHNPTEEQYDKAVENFIYSCAGCCVATYILGICDRHNDNIMLKTSGHMFHIDFGKFLGHAQMFGNIKRDRAPFVFTSDMAYVINGGDKPSSRFHDFVDLCCEAYNLIRKHTHLFLNLLGLMLSCGIPELSDLDDLKYVYDALRSHESEADATVYFTRLIESSLGSVATKLNFFIHNLAQMKFSSSDERPALSFAPRIHTAKSDGVIQNLYVCRHIRTSNPSKGYAFVVKVDFEGQQEALLVQRTFEEFHELHSKLRLIFPSSRLPSFPSRFMIGRSRGEAMADRRKDELNGYVWHLVHAAPEVAQCDLVHTFFHPLPRDEKPGAAASKPAEISWSAASGKEVGEVKLSISYKSDKLFIMVMHIRGLQPLQDGTDPDPYVKVYLLPDPQKTSKKKTKAARRTCNPTYNQMLVYERIPQGDLVHRVIHLRVLGDGPFWENTLLGETFISLKRLVPGQHWVDWHPLAPPLLADSAH
ncbi:phosphatidylinositol 4-phosphate 3-kinase C2 domain-containing subunit beta [Thalassophryne amazonica]|uniref:phosphatidylinositol 4-phosphate 3-kinase C2 domain-containing subunit beta n=1 Tax=Thalassophryne amazonica TaxID=390379 RepID=UPI0014711F8F|nr:phosphatidylinositol 4-phosphate 3-kinase C2 domain-containing subunit beta [Thalassophryne amazonica]XP_034021285.1 phosphatidylinositol 4-phosphate 3-kinase C2 domain-containing subunit beta [Thalassophryne amazonica]